MIFDTFDARNIFSRYPPGMALVLGLHHPPDINDAVPDDDIFAEHMRPALPLELG